MMKECKITPRMVQAATVGFMAGSRASSGPAITSILLSKGVKPTGKILAVMAGKKAVRWLVALVLPELILDKMPFTGDRIEAAGVVGRAVSGGLGGAAIFRAAGKPVLPGIVAGSTAAVLSTYSLYYLRKEVCKKTGIKDPWIGLAEDLLIIGIGTWLIGEKVKSLK